MSWISKSSINDTLLDSDLSGVSSICSISSILGVSPAVDDDSNQGQKDDYTEDDSNDMPDAGSRAVSPFVNKIVVVAESGHLLLIIIDYHTIKFKTGSPDKI